MEPGGAIDSSPPCAAEARLNFVGTLWLHRSHGSPGLPLVPLTVPKIGSHETVAQAFAAGATFSARAHDSSRAAGDGDGIIGVPCRIADRRLCMDTGSGGLTPVAEFLLAEISYAPFPVTSRPDLMVIAMVLPVSGEGIMGTQLGGADLTGRDCWFLLSPGGQHLDALDTMGMLGSVRCDLSEAYQPQTEGDGILGEGAYAIVRCMRARDGNAVAVKNMNATVELPAIQREIATLIDTQPHEHIVGFRGMFWQMEEGKPRMAVAFDVAPFRDLLYKVLKFGAMAEAEARTLFQGVMSALAHIHSRNIVHRDIKAENILLATQGSAVVADFGLATWVSDATQMVRRCGSPGYVAPEVCLGNPYSFKVDVFGAGVVLYFLLSKEMPFSSPDRDTAATMRRTVKCSLHLHRPPWDKMTSRLRNILRQTICKSQEDRLSSQGVLEHPWLIGPVPRPALTTEQLQQLQQQQAMRKQQDDLQQGPAEQQAQMTREQQQVRAQQAAPSDRPNPDEQPQLPSLRNQAGASVGGGTSPPGAGGTSPGYPFGGGGGSPAAAAVPPPQGPNHEAPVPPARPAHSSFRRGRGAAYPTGGRDERPPEAHSMLPGLPAVSTPSGASVSSATPMGHMSPHESNAGYPSQCPISTYTGASPSAGAPSSNYGGRVSPTGANSAAPGGANQGPMLPPVGDDDGRSHRGGGSRGGSVARG